MIEMSKYSDQDVLDLLDAVAKYVRKAHHRLDWSVIAPELDMTPGEAKAMWRSVAYKKKKMADDDDSEY